MLGDRGGRGGFSRGFSPSFSRGVLPAPGRVRAKKSSGPAAASADIAGAAAGVRSNTSTVLLILAQRGIPQPAAGLFERAGQDTGSASRLTSLPGFSQRSAGRVHINFVYSKMAKASKFRGANRGANGGRPRTTPSGGQR